MARGDRHACSYRPPRVFVPTATRARADRHEPIIDDIWDNFPTSALLVMVVGTLARQKQKSSRR